MNTQSPIDFWFDFISPYAYFASRRIDELAARHGREVRWRPMLLGVSVIKIMGLKPLMDTPIKSDYVARDLRRMARRWGLVLGRDLHAMPINPVPAGRVMAWLDEHARDLAKPFARQVFDRYWGLGVDTNTPQVLREALVGAGADAAQSEAALAREPAATLLQASVSNSIAAGVFGSPFIIADGEPFWGHDRLAELDAWLDNGGW